MDITWNVACFFIPYVQEIINDSCSTKAFTETVGRCVKELQLENNLESSTISNLFFSMNNLKTFMIIFIIMIGVFYKQTYGL